MFLIIGGLLRSGGGQLFRLSVCPLVCSPLLPGMLTCISFSLLFFSHCFFLSVATLPSFSPSSSSSSISHSLFFVDVSTQIQLEDLHINDNNSFSSLSCTTNSKFSLVNQEAGVPQEAGILLSSSAQFMVLWRLSGSQTDGQTGETSWCLPTKSPAGAAKQTYSILCRLHSRSLQFETFHTVQAGSTED